MTKREEFFKPEDAIYTYTSKQAVEDGVLFDIDPVQKYLMKNPFKYVTANLMAKGYLDGDKVNIPNLQDLIMAALMIYCRMPTDDYFASGNIELPSGDKQKIFIAQNETGRFTIMLPEDY